MTHSAGEALPPIDESFPTWRMMAYGAATWDWYQVHFDHKVAASMGLPGPFVDGQQWGAVFARQLREHFGPQAFVTKMALRYHAMVFADERVTGSAEITNIRHEPGAQVAEVLHRLEKDGRPVASCRSEVRLPD